MESVTVTRRTEEPITGRTEYYTWTLPGIFSTETITYSLGGWTFTPPDYTFPTYSPGDYPYYSNVERNVLAGWAIAVGVIFGLQLLGLIIVAIIYLQRQKKRKAWYGRMAAHYRNGGLPPWATATVVVNGIGDGSVKAPLHNNYNTSSGMTYPITHNTQNPGPQAQYNNPSQFGMYGNLPPSNTQSTGPYSSATGQTGYMATTYHTANGVPLSPPPQSLSPQPRHSHYSTTMASNVYNATPNAPPTQDGAPSAPAPGTPAPFDTAPAYDSTPKEPPHAGAGGSTPAPSYSGAPYDANEYPKEKGWEYTATPAEHPPKQ